MPLWDSTGAVGVATPSGTAGAVQCGFVGVVAADGGRQVVDPGEAAVMALVDARQTTMAASPPGGRKRQRSSPVWAETASGLGSPQAKVVGAGSTPVASGE